MPLHLPAANAQAPLDPDLPDPLAIPRMPALTPKQPRSDAGRLKIKKQQKKMT